MKQLTTLIALLLCLPAVAQRKTCIDDGWRFRYGTADATTTSAADFDDSAWRRLDLPHDWSVETEAAAAAGGTVIGPFSTNSVGKYQTGNTVGGEGWYRRTLNLSAADLAQQLTLYFEGAYNQARVWVNGQQVADNVYGYISFRADITPYVHEGANTIAVRVQNTGNNTRWYAGSGIYRHVWLLRKPTLHIDEWGTFVNAQSTGSIEVQFAAINTSDASKNGVVKVQIIDAQGQQVAHAEQALSVEAGKTQLSVLQCQLENPHLWSPETPYRYTARLSLSDEGSSSKDEFSLRFGIRSIAYSATEGFLLNGEPTLLRGGCVHHDNGILGAAAFDRAEDRKLQLLKDNGFNAVRCSHNLPSEHFLDACDSLGLMVIDETFDQWLRKKNADDYHRFFAEHSTADIQTMVRRDRNHPSIIMWSIGNEIPGRIEPAGMEAAARLREAIRELDTTRPITAAICGWDEGDAWNSAARDWDQQDAKAFQSLDIGGYNYLYDKYEHDHGTHPDRVMCGLESYPKQASQNWDLVEQKPYVIGDFVWTAMDYLGEAGIGSASIRTSGSQSMFQAWPWYNGWCGDIDLIGQKKPQSYYRDVVWHRAPITMGVERPVPAGSHQSVSAWGWQLEEQSWTFPGLGAADKMTVNVYSRAPRVRVYLNNNLIGEQATSDTYWAGFSVPYERGTLRAVNLDAAGNEVAGEEFVLRTTGDGIRLRVTYDKPFVEASTADIVYATIELVDGEDNVVTSDCTTRITIANAGAGDLVATGTASPTDMASFRNTTLTLFRGRAQAIVRGNGTAGQVEVNATIYEAAHDFTSSYILTNPDFGEGTLSGWTSTGAGFRYNGVTWQSTPIAQYAETDATWAGKTTLAATTLTQSTKVLPAGTYTVTLDYGATIRTDSPHQSEGTLRGVTLSANGSSAALTTINASEAQTASLAFTVSEPQAVTLRIDFGTDTNADWFALDNVQVSYAGDYDFATRYSDMTALVPGTDGSGWPKVSGNASGAYTETKLGSDIYNGEGLAYWSASAPRSKNLFEQTIADLPAGRYGLAAFAAANLWSRSDDDRNHRPGTYLFAKTATTEETAEVTTATYGLYSLVIDVQEGQRLTIGLNASAQNGNNWCYLAGVTLVSLGTDTEDAIAPLRTQQPYPTRIYDLVGRRVGQTANNQPSNRRLPNGIYIAGDKKVVVNQ